MQDPFTEEVAKAKVDATCPGCSHTIQVSMAQALAGDRITCAGCGRTIELKADPSVKQSLDDIDRSMRDLGDTLRRLGS